MGKLGDARKYDVDQLDVEGGGQKDVHGRHFTGHLLCIHQGFQFHRVAGPVIILEGLIEGVTTTEPVDFFQKIFVDLCLDDLLLFFITAPPLFEFLDQNLVEEWLGEAHERNEPALGREENLAD